MKEAPLVIEPEAPLPVADPFVSTVKVVELGTVTILKSPFISSAVRPLVAPNPARVTNLPTEALCALAVVTVIVPEPLVVVTVAFICVGAATATVGAAVGAGHLVCRKHLGKAHCLK